MNSKLGNAGENGTFKSRGSKRDSARSSFIVLALPALLLFSALLPAPGSSAADRMSADPGDLVPSFGTGGVVKTDFAGGHDAAIAVAITRTGKIIAAGSATIPGNGTDFALACYDGNGNLDPTFGNGGKVTADFFGGNDGARGAVVQTDQKIVLSGFATNAGERQFAFVRVNPDGSLDTTFGQGGKVSLDLGSTSEAFKVALQPDNKIVAVGDSRPQNSLDFTVVRLNPSDGSPDTTFGNNGIVRVDFGNADRAIDLVIDEENIFVAGIVVKTATDSDFGIVRLNISNGSLNNAFDGDGRLTVDFFGGQDGAQSIIPRPPTFDILENHLIVGGYATNGTQDFGIAAIRYNGRIIESFFDEGQAKKTFDFKNSRDQIFSLFNLPDGSFGAAGWAGDGDSFDLGVAFWDYSPTRRWELSGNFTHDTSSGGNNVAYDVVLYEDTVISAGTGINPATGNDDFILTKHEDKQYAEIIKRAPATPVLRGNEITYTFEIKNLTDNELLLLVVDVLPVGVTFEESQNPDWTKNRFTSGLSSGIEIERRLRVPGGQTSFIALRVRADQSGILKNEANLLLPHFVDFSGYYTTTFLSSSEVESEVKEPLTAAHVSAASFSGSTLAGESIVAAFGTALATNTEVATSVPLPTSLAGTTVNVRDSAGFDRPASLFFVSPGQINYAMPVGVALGATTVTITSESGAVSVGNVLIEAVAPGLFAANASGQGVAAAQVLRVKADGAQIFEQTAVFDTATGQFIAAPIDLGPPGEQVFMVLFGTGIRFRSALPAVQLSVGGTNLEASFAGAQGGFVALDQLNALLPRSLAGLGVAQIGLAVDGKTANVVEVNIR